MEKTWQGALCCALAVEIHNKYPLQCLSSGGNPIKCPLSTTNVSWRAGALYIFSAPAPHTSWIHHCICKLLWEWDAVELQHQWETQSKINFISDISANKTPRQAFICIFSTVVVCLSYSGIRAVTFFSHSALPSLSLLPPDFPKVPCFMCAFLWNRGAGRVERSRDERPRRGRMKWGGCLFSAPKPHTFLEWLWSVA